MNNNILGGTWNELQRELFTPEEIAASNLRVALIGEVIKDRALESTKKVRLTEKDDDSLQKSEIIIR